MQVCQEMPGCLGVHLCGAYTQNRIRYTALLHEDETPDQAAVDGITAVNLKAQQWLAKYQE